MDQTSRDNRSAAYDKALACMRERERLVFCEIDSHSGQTPSEMAANLGLDVTMIRPRCTEMCKRGILKVVGKRPNKWGNNESVYDIPWRMRALL